MRSALACCLLLVASAANAYDIYSGGVPLPPDHGVWLPVTIAYQGQQPLEVPRTTADTGKASTGKRTSRKN